jgi:hypothetical protein
MGQRLMRAPSDIMLGWTEGKLRGRHLYVCQLCDMKLSAVRQTMEPETLRAYGRMCGRTLVAGARARSGDAAMISGWLGKRQRLRRLGGEIRRGLRGADRERLFGHCARRCATAAWRQPLFSGQGTVQFRIVETPELLGEAGRGSFS